MLLFKKDDSWLDVFIIPTCQSNFIVGDSCNSNHGNSCSMYHMNFNFFGIVFIPYCYKQHWCLLMLNVRSKLIYHFNPLPIGDKHGERLQIKGKQRAIEAFLRYLAKCREMSQTNGEGFDNLAFIEWKWNREIERPYNLPYQSDGYNCGPLVIYYMRLLSGMKTVENFEANQYRLELKKLLSTKYDSIDLTCIYCYNDDKNDVVYCNTCALWAHRTCLERGLINGVTQKNKGLGTNKACEICTSNL